MSEVHETMNSYTSKFIAVLFTMLSCYSDRQTHSYVSWLQTIKIYFSLTV